jgi:hypothetical protein
MNDLRFKKSPECSSYRESVSAVVAFAVTSSSLTEQRLVTETEKCLVVTSPGNLAGTPKPSHFNGNVHFDLGNVHFDNQPINVHVLC